jgi:hypothetical protein
LWFCFAYKNQTSDAAIQGAWVTGIFSLMFLACKMLFGDFQTLGMICIFSIIVIILEVVTFLLVRRRRILVPISNKNEEIEQSYQRLEESKNDDFEESEDHKTMLSEPYELLKFPESRYVDVNGIIVHYVYKVTENAAATIILLHGFGGGSFSW